MTIDKKLEPEYALQARHPERAQIYEDYTRRSALLRESERCAIDLRYADTDRALLDVFYAENPSGTVLIFIHGGYWRALDKSIFSFLAKPFLDAGISVVMPGYPLAPAVSVAEIVECMHRMVDWLENNALAAGEPDRLVISGHSAGGHLAALLASTRDPATFRASIPVSGLFDLAPLTRTSINDDVHMDEQCVADASPIRHIAQSMPPTLALVGGDETDGFITQSTRYVAALRSAGHEARSELVPGTNHFTVLDQIADPQSMAFRAMLELCS